MAGCSGTRCAICAEVPRASPTAAKNRVELRRQGASPGEGSWSGLRERAARAGAGLFTVPGAPPLPSPPGTRTSSYRASALGGDLRATPSSAATGSKLREASGAVAMRYTDLPPPPTPRGMDAARVDGARRRRALIAVAARGHRRGRVPGDGGIRSPPGADGAHRGRRLDPRSRPERRRDRHVGRHRDRRAPGSAAYVFVKSGGAWTQQARLVPGDGAAGDGFGASVAISADTAVVGAPWGTGARAPPTCSCGAGACGPSRPSSSRAAGRRTPPAGRSLSTGTGPSSPPRRRPTCSPAAAAPGARRSSSPPRRRQHLERAPRRDRGRHGGRGLARGQVVDGGRRRGRRVRIEASDWGDARRLAAHPPETDDRSGSSARDLGRAHRRGRAGHRQPADAVGPPRARHGLRVRPRSSGWNREARLIANTAGPGTAWEAPSRSPAARRSSARPWPIASINRTRARRRVRADGRRVGRGPAGQARRRRTDRRRVRQDRRDLGELGHRGLPAYASSSRRTATPTA